VSELFAAVVSVVPTKRGKFFWAAWWAAPPEAKPFRRPDASSGGARSLEEAVQAAERAADRPLTTIEPHWAGAWRRVLRGDPPWPPGGPAGPPPERPRASEPASRRASPHAILGVEPDADEPAIKRAYRKRALETHPDRGGDPAVFRAVQRAYELSLAKLSGSTRRRKR
jgi:hypothetical protein